MNLIIVGSTMFTGIILALVALILAARKQLVPTGEIKFEINDDPELTITTKPGVSFSVPWPRRGFSSPQHVAAVAPAVSVMSTYTRVAGRSSPRKLVSSRSVKLAKGCVSPVRLGSSRI